MIKFQCRNYFHIVEKKDKLTEYLAKNMYVYLQIQNKIFIVAWYSETACSHCLNHLCNTHEEADTKILLHATDMAESGEINCYSLHFSS